VPAAPVKSSLKTSDMPEGGGGTAASACATKTAEAPVATSAAAAASNRRRHLSGELSIGPTLHQGT
jgi:hypothetical protein